MGVSSVGIVAQSVGGGGGAGGFAGGLSFTTTGKADNTVGGGAGGGGGAAGEVTVTSRAGALVHTYQANSTGILAQSIGGGGGNGDFSDLRRGLDRRRRRGAGRRRRGRRRQQWRRRDRRQRGRGADRRRPVEGVFAQSVGGGGGNRRVQRRRRPLVLGRPRQFVSRRFRRRWRWGGAVSVTNGAAGLFSPTERCPTALSRSRSAAAAGRADSRLAPLVSLGGDAKSTVGGGAGRGRRGIDGHGR